MRPKERCEPYESPTLTAYSLVAVCATLHGVDTKFEPSVIVDIFHPGICLRPQKLHSYNISRQEPTGEARIDERASLVVLLAILEVPFHLRGLVDTGLGVSSLAFSAFNSVAV